MSDQWGAPPPLQQGSQSQPGQSQDQGLFNWSQPVQQAPYPDAEPPAQFQQPQPFPPQPQSQGQAQPQQYEQPQQYNSYQQQPPAPMQPQQQPPQPPQPRPQHAAPPFVPVQSTAPHGEQFGEQQQTSSGGYPTQPPSYDVSFAAGAYPSPDPAAGAFPPAAQMGAPMAAPGGGAENVAFSPASTRGRGHHRHNGAALTGAITSFVPVVGLVLSLIGLAKARLIGAGRGIALVGIALSLLFTAAWGVAGYSEYKLVNSTATDSGCISADSDYTHYQSVLQQDAAAMAKSTVGTSGFTAAVQQYRVDLGVLISAFNSDAAKAGAPNLKSAIQGVTTDLTQLDNELGDVAVGHYAGATNLMDENGTLLTDFQRMENVCTGRSSG